MIRGTTLGQNMYKIGGEEAVPASFWNYMGGGGEVTQFGAKGHLFTFPSHKNAVQIIKRQRHLILSAKSSTA